MTTQASKSIWDASPKELVATINIAMMSQVTISSENDKGDWRDIANRCMDELTVRGIDTKLNKKSLLELL